MDMSARYTVLLTGYILCISSLQAHVNNGTNGDSETYQLSGERKLINFLLARYKMIGTVSRPVRDATQRVRIYFGIRLVYLDLDEKEQTMTTSVWVRMRWTDEFLRWDPADYNGTTSVVLPVEKIWRPDPALVNTAETTVDEQPAGISVSNEGRVFWAPQRKYSSACLIDVTEYPYDKHTCDMWFQMITNPSTHVTLAEYLVSPLDLDTYLTSYKHAQEWDILSNTTTRHVRPRDVGMILMWSRRTALRFSLTVQRRAGFKGVLLIVPCTLLSFLIPVVFCFPTERPDRHSLAMSIFASLTILLFMVNEVAPPSASFVPRLALYYSFNLMVLLLATCCSVVVVNLNKRGEIRERVPNIVRLIFIKTLGPALCFGRRLEHLSAVKRASGLRSPVSEEIRDDDAAGDGILEKSDDPSVIASADYHVFVNLNRKLSSIENRIMARRKQETVLDVRVPVDLKLEWQTLALVLDRLFFVVFIIIDIISCGMFYPRTP